MFDRAGLRARRDDAAGAAHRIGDDRLRRRCCARGSTQHARAATAPARSSGRWPSRSAARSSTGSSTHWLDDTGQARPRTEDERPGWTHDGPWPTTAREHAAQHRATRRGSGASRPGSSTGSASRSRVLDDEPPAVLPVVPRRDAEHLLQRARPARRRRPRRPPALIYDSPVTGTQHDAHLRRAARAGRRLRRGAARARRREGRPGRHLHADDPRGGRRDAGLRADRRGALGGVRRLRRRTSSRSASTTRGPKVVVAASCGIEPTRVVEYKPILDRALELAEHQPDVRAWSSSGRRPRRR